MNILNKNNKNWTSKKKLMNNLQIDPDTIERIISSLSIEIGFDTQNHIKKDGYRNSEIFYDDCLLNMIIEELSKHNTNQNTGAIQKQEIILNAVAKSGDLKAAYALWDLIVEKTRLQAKNKRLSEFAKQMETIIIINIVCVFIYLLIHSLF
ncbi:MAG: hypothetical protein SPF22_07350 [Candidatus Onthovivens sp.]|nr:hypothetical protein [Candidatus Onthovivens sp.]